MYTNQPTAIIILDWILPYLFYKSVWIPFIISIECYDCKKEYPLKEGWCNKCDLNQFLEESKIIGCYKKLDELSRDEKKCFKSYGICPDCKQMNTEYACIINVI